jgi:hypothetical protein
MTITKVWFENKQIYIQTDSGEKISNPLAWYKRLANASDQQLSNYVLSPYGIHWEELDEDLSFEGFLTYNINKID